MSTTGSLRLIYILRTAETILRCWCCSCCDQSNTRDEIFFFPNADEADGGGVTATGAGDALADVTLAGAGLAGAGAAARTGAVTTTDFWATGTGFFAGAGAGLVT